MRRTLSASESENTLSNMSQAFEKSRLNSERTFARFRVLLKYKLPAFFPTTNNEKIVVLNN